jgi:NAD(P)-dependent dehydrogenase (short-subunit alcohol dehydrogenase family)
MAVAHLVAPPNTSAIFEGIAAANRAGETEHFEVFYDRSMGETGRHAGAIVLNRAERDLATVQDWFGTPEFQKRFVVFLSRRAEGSRTCREPASGPVETLFCDVQTTPHLEAFQSCFFVAFHLADVLAGTVGWGDPSGEALARVLAAALYPRRIAGFATARHWLESDREDFWSGPLPPVAEATGAAVLFFNYLHYQLGFSWHSIAMSPAATLADVARLLTGSDDEHSTFQSLLDQFFPPGRPTGLFIDNPFPLVMKTALPAGPDNRSEARSSKTASQPSVDRRVCLLTGASGSLGRHICELLSDRYQFAAVHRSRPVVSDLFSIEADLTKDGECERVVEAALSRFARIDLVINAAMVSGWGSLLDSESLLNSAQTQFLTNVIVPMKISSAVASRFWSDHIPENRASNRNVINISSVSGQTLYLGEGQSVYAASKAALDHLTGHMAHEFAAINVRVNALAPNSFPTNVAVQRVVQAIETLDRRSDTGTIVIVDGDADRIIHLMP